MMTTIDELQDMGIRLSIQGGRLHAGPTARIDEDIRELIAANRQALMEAVLERERAPDLLKEARATIDRLLTKREAALEHWQKSEETIAWLKRELETAKARLEIAEDYSRVLETVASIRQSRLQPPAIPPDIRRALISCCHPDRASNQQAAQKAMTWLNINTQSRGES